jgi:uncharacterized membrane protein YqhA
LVCGWNPIHCEQGFTYFVSLGVYPQGVALESHFSLLQNVFTHKLQDVILLILKMLDTNLILHKKIMYCFFGSTKDTIY